MAYFTCTHTQLSHTHSMNKMVTATGVKWCFTLVVTWISWGFMIFSPFHVLIQPIYLLCLYFRLLPKSEPFFGTTKLICLSSWWPSNSSGLHGALTLTQRRDGALRFIRILWLFFWDNNLKQETPKHATWKQGCPGLAAAQGPMNPLPGKWSRDSYWIV